MNPNQRLLSVVNAANPSLRAAATPASLLQGGSVTPQYAGVNPQGNTYNPQANQINTLQNWSPNSVPRLNPQVQIAPQMPLNVGRSVINPGSGAAGAAGYTPTPSVAQSVIGGAAGLGRGLLSMPAYFVNTDIVNPTRELYNQFTGNKLGYQNAVQQSNEGLGLGPNGNNLAGGLRKFAGNTAQLATFGAGGLAGKAGGAVASKVGGGLLGTVAKGATEGALLGGPYNVASDVAGNQKLTPGSVGKSFAVGAGTGGVLGGLGGLLNGSLGKQATKVGIDKDTLKYLQSEKDPNAVHNVLKTIYGDTQQVADAAQNIANSENGRFIIRELGALPAQAGGAALTGDVAGQMKADQDLARQALEERQRANEEQQQNGPTSGTTDPNVPTAQFTPAEAQVLKEAGVPSPAEASAPPPTTQGLSKSEIKYLQNTSSSHTPEQQNLINNLINKAHTEAGGKFDAQGAPIPAEDAAKAVEKATAKNTAAPTESLAKAETQKAAQETTGKVASETPISDNAVYNNAKNAGVSDELAGELQKVVDAHNTPVPKGATGGDVAKLAAGRLQEARARAEGLTNEITKELSASEQKELRALAEGEITVDQATPAVRAVYEALKPVNGLAGDTLNALNGSGTVEHYFPREAISGLKTPEGAKYTTGGSSVSTPGIQKAKDLFGIGDKPANSLGRSVYRFVGNDGTVLYGTPGSTGMSGLADGTFEKNGEIFKMEHAPQSEIENSGVVKYNQNEAKVLGNYHGNVLASSSRHQLLKNIKNASDVRPADEALAGDVPIKNVAGLEKYVTTPETAKAIEASPLAQNAPKGLTGTVFNKASRFVIQSIVANPIFHGGNQEFNALFSAAWQMPGNKVSNMVDLVKNQAKFVGNSEAYDAWRTRYFTGDAAGHSPGYGKDYHGFITQGAAKVFGDNATKVTKLSANAMSAIEENIRVATFKDAVESGMTDAEAGKTVDRVLGGQDVVKDMESTTGLFLHYLKTNVKNIGKSGAEALQGNVAPVAGLALGYGAWFAANKALQTETGYTLRAPGAAGIINQFGKAPGQVAKGEIPGVVRNHINPLISFGAQAGTNRDFTKPITSSSNQIYGKNKNELGTVAGRTLFGPGQGVQDVAGGKETAAQAGLAAGLGVYAPYKATSTSAFQNGTNTGPPKTIADLQAQNQKVNRDFVASLGASDTKNYTDGKGNFINFNTATDAHNRGILNDDQYNHYLALAKTRDREFGNAKYQNQALDAAHASGKIDDQQYALTKAFEQSQANMTTQAKNAVAKRGPDATQQAIADYINNQLPPGLSKVQANPDLAKTFADFTKATATNAAKAPEDQETPIDYQDRTIRFWAQVAKDGAPANVQSVYRDGGNKAAMFVKQGKATQDDVNQAVGLDNMLLASGIITTPKFSEKWRSANGFPSSKDFMEGGANYGTAGVGQYLSNGNNSVVATGKGGSRGGGGGFGNGNTTALNDGSGIFSSVNKKTGDVTLKNVASLNGSGTTAGEVDPGTGLFIAKPTGITKLLNTKDTLFKSPGINLPTFSRPQAAPKLKSFAAPDVRGTPRPQRAVPIRFQRAKFK